ncbi:hypothetical protein R3P38DRAFT_3125561 [Favolaschia claudopus]|uniref:Transmembrane protein n=1 Tax=Favolaschia claudopus TaxID=2862362 RepID=A0AAV9ZAI5_9AGAR
MPKRRLQFPAFLFNPLLRVWNLRLLLLLSALNIFLNHAANGWYFTTLTSLTFLAPSIVIFHHLTVLILCGTALMDLCLTGIEIASEFVSLVVSTVVTIRSIVRPDDLTLRAVAYCGTFGILLLLSILAVSARIATIAKCDQPLIHQRFSMLGGCRRTHPTYTAFRILFGRAIARPLVRGESKLITIARALVTFGIFFAAPAFAFYSIILVPGTEQIYIKTIYLQDRPSPGNASIFWDSYSSLITANVTVVPFDKQLQVGTCVQEYIGVDCPLLWTDVSQISISMEMPEATSWASVMFASNTAYGLQRDILLNELSVSLFPGSHLVGELTWIRRDLMSPPQWGIPSPAETIYLVEIRNLQPQPYPISTNTIDSTALTGVSTFGGFWTFLSGAYALLFGAHVLYFMLGRRPLSALGIVHIFQQEALIRQWHEDFPAIHTEGGLPGSKHAGIIAFIRDRLVDLDPDPKQVDEEFDSGAQIKKLMIKITSMCAGDHPLQGKSTSGSMGDDLREVTL